MNVKLTPNNTSPCPCPAPGDIYVHRKNNPVIFVTGSLATDQIVPKSLVSGATMTIHGLSAGPLCDWPRGLAKAGYRRLGQDEFITITAE